MWPGSSVSGLYLAHPESLLLRRRAGRARPGRGLRRAARACRSPRSSAGWRRSSTTRPPAGWRRRSRPYDVRLMASGMLVSERSPHSLPRFVRRQIGARLPAPGRRDRRARQACAPRLPADGDAQPPSPSAGAPATGSRGAPLAPRFRDPGAPSAPGRARINQFSRRLIASGRSLAGRRRKGSCRICPSTNPAAAALPGAAAIPRPPGRPRPDWHWPGRRPAPRPPR